MLLQYVILQTTYTETFNAFRNIYRIDKFLRGFNFHHILYWALLVLPLHSFSYSYSQFQLPSHVLFRFIFTSVKNVTAIAIFLYYSLSICQWIILRGKGECKALMVGAPLKIATTHR